MSVASECGELNSYDSDRVARTARVSLLKALGQPGRSGQPRNAHKLVPLIIDDQTSPSEIATAVPDVISKGVFGIVFNSVQTLLAAKYPQEVVVPLIS